MTYQTQRGITIVELMVALAIGSFLMIGAIQIYNQSRQAFVVNESIARVQETAQFAMDIVERDVRMAGNWGRTSRGLSIQGRSLVGDANPDSLTVPATCGERWVLDLALPLDGGDSYGSALSCAPTAGVTAAANSDVVTIRRGSLAASAMTNGALKLQTTRTQGALFTDATPPAALDVVDAETHDLMVNSYYVATDSELIAGSPALRRKTLRTDGTIVDEEVVPGVENLQLQLGIDVDGDDTVDRYVNPDSRIFDPSDALNYVAGSRVLTARLWMVVRGTTLEPGIEDNTDYEPGNVDLGVPNDQFRRMQFSKTILLRNSRT